MRALVEKRSSRSQVHKELGMPFEAFPNTQDPRFAERARAWNQKVATIEQEARMAKSSEVFLIGDMVHFTFYGHEEQLRAYVCVGN